MVSKALLLLLAIVAARFGGPTRRPTLALACEEEESMVGLDSAPSNNRYNSYYASNNNGYKNNNDYENMDGMADRSIDDNNDSYEYNKVPAKLQLPQQKLYANSQQQQQQQQQSLQQLQRQQQQFAADPEPAARNDFLSQLSDLNAQVVGMFAAEDSSNSNSNSNSNADSSNNYSNSNNAWQPDVAADQAQLPLGRQSRSSNRNRYAGGQPERYSSGQPADVDVEGEEDFAVARATDADELSDQLPYGIQNVRKRRVRSVMPPPAPLLAQPGGESDGVTYQSLCPTKRVTVKLENGEYRPNHYVEVTCANNYAPLPARLHGYDNYNYRNNELPLLRALLNERVGEKREICSATGFACIQLNRTIHLIRLNEISGCWESETRTVPSGCECMWPKHSYGDIASYHQAQKRFRNTLNHLQARKQAGNIDYTPGVGYRQLSLRSRTPKAGVGAGAGRSRRADALDYDNYEFN